MSTINGFDPNAMSSLFSSMGTTNTSSTSNGMLGINLNDYASIRNGSYGKLMKSYYALDEEKVNDKKSKNDTDDSDATIRGIKTAADELKDSAAALYSSKGLFAKDVNGEYNMEAIYEKVNAFIEDYNSMIGSVGSAETEGIANAGASIVNNTSNNIDMLSKLGVSVSGADFTLSIDKEKFLKANISDVKSMFSGVGSFAYQVGAKASRIYTMVEDKVSGSGYKSSRPDSSSSTSKDTANTIAKMKDRANDLVSTGTDLYKNRKLFDKDTNGKYDTNEIVEEISAFIKDYNDLLISTENTKSSGIESAMKTLEGITDAYKKDLTAIGITVDKEDGTLNFDEKSFLNSDMKAAKALFTGTGSFAYQITLKATMVANQAETEANKANTYTDNATFGNNHNTGSIFDGTI